MFALPPLLSSRIYGHCFASLKLFSYFEEFQIQALAIPRKHNAHAQT